MKILERSRELVSLKPFADTGVPEKMKIGTIDLILPEQRQYILRMPVRVNGGNYCIPTELEWLNEMFFEAYVHQGVLGVNHPFCYITVRHGLVESQTDDEWHVDGFSTREAHVPEQNYVWCSTVGTEYTPLQVNFPADFDPLVHNIHHYLRRFVDESKIESCEEKTVYCFDPYLLHRRPVSTSGTMRTFIRISFVPIEINDVNNTQNPLLPREYTRDGVKHRDTLVLY